MKQEDGAAGKWSSCGREASEGEQETHTSSSDRDFKVYAVTAHILFLIFNILYRMLQLMYEVFIYIFKINLF